MELDVGTIVRAAALPVLFYGAIILLVGRIIRAAFREQVKRKTDGFVDDPFISDDDTA